MINPVAQSTYGAAHTSTTIDRQIRADYEAMARAALARMAGQR